MRKPDCFERVRRSLLKEEFFRRRDRVIAACSGGSDSIFLLHVLLALREDLDLSLWVAHFNHGIRPDAGKDEAFVRDLAGRFSLPVLVEARNVMDLAREQGKNLEEAAREYRYDFLFRVAAQVGAHRIAVAHTRTDQAETVLLRLLRGAGPRGLAGIPPYGENGVVRPLLDVSRSDIQASLRAAGREYRTDPSNRDRRLLRNRIRHELIPLLEVDYARGIERRLADLARIMREEEKWGEERVREAGPGVLRGEGLESSIDLDAMADWAPALRRRMMREFFKRIRGGLRGITFEDVETALSLERGREFLLREGVPIRNQGGRIQVRPVDRERVDFAAEWALDGPLSLPGTGLVLKAERLRGPITAGIEFDDRRSVCLDGEKIRLPLVVRRRREGDRYRPLGAPGRRRLKEIFRSRGIPVWERDFRPVLVSGGQIAWVVGCPAAEAFKLTDSTTTIIRITVEQDAPIQE